MIYFLDVFNNLLSRAAYLTSWKIGSLILFQKNGKKLNCANIRPITLLPTLGKLLESLYAKRIEEELSDRQFFSVHQHGFTKRKSTSTAINEAIGLISSGRM